MSAKKKTVTRKMKPRLGWAVVGEDGDVANINFGNRMGSRGDLLLVCAARVTALGTIDKNWPEKLRVVRVEVREIPRKVSR